MHCGRSRLLTAFPRGSLRRLPIVFPQLDGGEVHHKLASSSSWLQIANKLRGTQAKSSRSLGKRAPVHGTGLSTESARKQLPHTRTSVLDPLMADTNPFSRKRARTCRPARLARSGEHAAYLLLRRAVVAAAAHRGPAVYHGPLPWPPAAAACCRQSTVVLATRCVE